MDTLYLVTWLFCCVLLLVLSLYLWVFPRTIKALQSAWFQTQCFLTLWIQGHWRGPERGGTSGSVLVSRTSGSVSRHEWIAYHFSLFTSHSLYILLLTISQPFLSHLVFTPQSTLEFNTSSSYVGDFWCVWSTEDNHSRKKSHFGRRVCTMYQKISGESRKQPFSLRA